MLPRKRQLTCLITPAAVIIFTVTTPSSVPRWRNRQTQWTQNPPGFTTHAGSTPALGTIFFVCATNPHTRKRLKARNTKDQFP